MYDALGAKVTVVEMLDQLLPGCDPDLVRALYKRIGGRYEDDAPRHQVEERQGPEERAEGGALGRRVAEVRPGPGRRRAGAQRSGHRRGGRGGRARRARLHPRRLADAHERPRTSTRSATWSASRCSPTRPSHEAKVAAEVIAGHDVEFDATTIPSVAYTDPEVAWMGLTETRGQGRGHRVREGDLPLGRLGPRPVAWAATRA